MKRPLIGCNEFQQKMLREALGSDDIKTRVLTRPSEGMDSRTVSARVKHGQSQHTPSMYSELTRLSSIAIHCINI